MKIFTFHSQQDDGGLEPTTNRPVGNLPPHYASWQQSTSGGAVAIDSNAAPVMHPIRRDSFILAIRADSASDYMLE
jgi:hypothetical protein